VRPEGDNVQTPAPFEYERAGSVDHALALLERHGPEARLVAGGHSLLPMMKLRLARPDVLVDINDLADLSYIRVDGSAIAIGAMTRHAELLGSSLLGEHYAIFGDAEQVIADPVVRNRGTIGGSFCQADPSEDLPAVGAALRAELVVRSADGTRTVPAREFHTGPYETVVGPAEILTEVRVPIRPGAGSAYEKVERRAGDWPIASAGAFVTLDGDTVRDVGIGLTAVGAAHFCAPEAEDALRGRPATDDSLATAAQTAAEACEPSADQRGPADYKRHLAGELTLRALRRSVARARAAGRPNGEGA
jgi:carbon-monoxide dehydrogenase medium subunit